LVRPWTVAILVDPSTLADNPPGEDVTVYPVMALPPSDEGAVQLSEAEALPATATMFVGAPGTAAGGSGVTALDGADAELGPTAFVATTVKV
jgi:hypothetical protein